MRRRYIMAKKHVDYLNKLVGSFGVLYIKLHQHHWFVKGPNFFEAHEKFEELYDETTANLDEVAERMLQLGHEPISTLKEFLDHSVIKETEFKNVTDATEMYKSVLEDFETLNKIYQDGFELFEGDEVTTDLLVGLQEAVQKHIWMIGAYLA